VQKDFLFVELFLLPFQFFLLLIKKLCFCDIRSHLFLEPDDLVLLPNSKETYIMMAKDNSSSYLFFLSSILARFSHYFCLLLIT